MFLWSMWYKDLCPLLLSHWNLTDLMVVVYLYLYNPCGILNEQIVETSVFSENTCLVLYLLYEVHTDTPLYLDNTVLQVFIIYITHKKIWCVKGYRLHNMPYGVDSRMMFNAGCKQSGVHLNDVVLPPWAKDDPREFIRAHREVNLL